MMKSRLIRSFLSLMIMATVVAGVLVTQMSVFAQDQTTPTPTPTPTLKLDCPYPALADRYGQYFNFDVDLKYYDVGTKLFNLSVASLDGWTLKVMSGSKEVSAVQLTGTDPQTPTIETITISMSSNVQYPLPGTYATTFKVSSDTINQSIALKATVLPQYSFFFTTDLNNATGVNSSPTIQANAGKDNLLTFTLANSGSAPVDNLALSSTVPTGWKVSFKPDPINSLGTGLTQQVDATITPPAGVKPGDYLLALKADNGTVSSTMSVRVSLVTPTFPAWGIMLIVVVVVLGLAVLYQLFVNKKRRV